MIGIVGGVGPLAGLDVFKKIIEETDGQHDQEHLPVLLMSYPHLIVDRTEYLLQKVETNPAYALANIIEQLANNGAKVVAIPCNTAHAPAIFSEVEAQLKSNEVKVKLLHLVKETVNHIKLTAPDARVAVLSTTGTRNTGLYKNLMIEAGLTVLEPSAECQHRIHEAIYDKAYGIKAFSSPVNEKALTELKHCMDLLLQENPTHFILGCTELPLAFPESDYKGIPLIDPNRIIARALINELNPRKLKK